MITISVSQTGKGKIIHSLELLVADQLFMGYMVEVLCWNEKNGTKVNCSKRFISFYIYI